LQSSHFYTVRFLSGPLITSPSDQWSFSSALRRRVGSVELSLDRSQRHHRLVCTLVNSFRFSRRPSNRCGRCACWSVDMGPPLSLVSSWSVPMEYFGSIRVQRDVYDRVLEFLRRNHGRKLREVMDSEIDIFDVIH
jgi:hypothetical protein